MLNQNFVLVGVIIAWIGALSYLIDVVKGKIKPNKVSYALWALAPVIAFAAEIKQGVGIQSLMTLSVGISPFAILLASFANRKAYWKITFFDLICGALSIAGLIIWQITKVGDTAIFFSILADGLAALPTMRKAFFYPETENAWPWLAASSNGFITLLTLKDWTFAHYSFPLYYAVVTLIIYIFVKFRIGKMNKIL